MPSGDAAPRPAAKTEGGPGTPPPGGEDISRLDVLCQSAATSTGTNIKRENSIVLHCILGLNLETLATPLDNVVPSLVTVPTNHDRLGSIVTPTHFQQN